MSSKLSQWAKTYLNRRMLVVLMLGFSSGLPLALACGTLQAWFKTSGASIVLIGFMTLISQPYSYKFLWSPLLDKYMPFKALDQRRSWILLMQLGIIAVIICMSLYKPDASVTIFNWQIPTLLLLGLFLSTFSATQDIAIDAYRVEVLHADERGLGSALGIEGYRIAMIASGGFALVMADKYGWQTTYLAMAGLMLIGVMATLIAPPVQRHAQRKESLPALIAESFLDFIKRPQAIWLLIFIILYKLGDAFSHALSSTFLLDLGFSLSEVGYINKILGVVATLVGVLVGGLFMTKVGLYRALMSFGILAAVTNLTYMLLAIVGKHFSIACAAVFIENICAGMGTAALVALIMSLCNPKFTATQFALLTSIAAVGRIYVGPVSGYMVEGFGWALFYGFSAAVAIPGLVLLKYLRNTVIARDITNKTEIVSSQETNTATTSVPQAVPQTN